MAVLPEQQPYQKLMNTGRNFLFKKFLIGNFERGRNGKISHWDSEVKLFERKHGSSGIPWRNPHFDRAVILIFMPPRFYMWIFLSLNATGSVEAASGLTQSKGIFDWATTIMSPWSTNFPSFLPLLKWTWAETHRCCFPAVADRKRSYFPMHLQFDRGCQAL